MCKTFARDCNYESSGTPTRVLYIGGNIAVVNMQCGQLLIIGAVLVPTRNLKWNVKEPFA